MWETSSETAGSVTSIRFSRAQMRAIVIAQSSREQVHDSFSFHDFVFRVLNCVSNVPDLAWAMFLIDLPRQEYRAQVCRTLSVTDSFRTSFPPPDCPQYISRYPIIPDPSLFSPIALKMLVGDLPIARRGLTLSTGSNSLQSAARN
jgi:hypothetical protein